ncbi:serine/threonine protein kinase-like protein [Aureobasidium sp. EXF-12298]|nr:serine/threonine protein kinase-like protein [Aureobasidium sp. EXF-12298]KAI4765332.1 serine/threonine protein kinase-like protein [Aureobasidium sp. EXF-12344]KAI4783163.1 serine/threonine protein kinase-like protein [Aureobasidium sp. EXF-3400]
MPAMDLDRTDIADTAEDISPKRTFTMSPPGTAAEPLSAILKSDLMKNKRKKKKKGGMAPAAPAQNVIRGFETPITSGGEESDVSTCPSPLMTPRMRGMNGAANSPRLSASSGSGISALKMQLDALSLSRPPSSPSMTRENSTTSNFDSTPTMSSAASDVDLKELETYQVDLEHDFASADACATPRNAFTVEGGLRTESALRKMTADDFEPLKCLGKGAFGTVHLVKQRATGRLFAQKQFRKASLTVHKRLIEQTRTERSILESVNRHPFVVKLFYAFQDHERLYLILEYAQGGELFTHLAMERMFTEEVASFYMAEMVLALEHLHRNVRVVYRDLKPENCLLDSDGHLLLTDFGLSKVALEEDSCSSFLGTVEYMAPEVVQGTSYGFAVDWWSLGAIGFDLLTGSPPFGGNNNAKIQQNILKQKLQLPYFLGPDSKDLLTRLLRKEANKRLGANMPKDLDIIKKHRFFRKIDWKKLAKRELMPPIQPLITDPELAENFSKEFTDLPMSPADERKSMVMQDSTMTGIEIGSSTKEFEVGSNPFGGFSFVASQSLLDKVEFM